MHRLQLQLPMVGRHPMLSRYSGALSQNRDIVRLALEVDDQASSMSIEHPALFVVGADGGRSTVGH